MASEPEALSSVEEFVGGWIGGLCRIPYGHALDSVKIAMTNAKPGTYTSMAHCIKSLVQRDGFLALYRGVQSPALGMAALNGTLYFSYSHGKDLMRWLDGGTTEPGSETFEQEVAAGLLAGAATSFVEGPVDAVKTQLQHRPGEYRSFVHCATHMVRTNPLTGLFQGLGPTLWRNTLGYVFFFQVYAHSLDGMAELSGSATPSVAQVLAAGGLAGTVFWALPYPFDHIKSRMQADTPVKATRAFPTMASTVRYVLDNHGVKGFYRGFVPCIVRAAPANAFAWAGYKYTTDGIRWWKGADDLD